ncbi:MAG: MATE family efflux transporter, partial [Nostocoides sp.]
LRAHPGRVLAAARGGAPLLVRTIALRGVLVATTWVAAGLGDVPLAGYQVAATIWSFLAFVLDALAIAAQALTGKALGAGDVESTRSATGLMIRWGVLGGFVLTLLILGLRDVLPHLFSSDPNVRAVVSAGLLIVALQQPLAGYVFVVDGVLIGAGDGRWLARAMVGCFVGYLPLIVGVHALGPRLLTASTIQRGDELAVTWLWLAFTGFMAVRGTLLWLRVRTDRWMVTGTSV